MHNNVTYEKKWFEKTTIKYLKDFILDNRIPDTDSIALDEKIFDELALDFRQIYKEPIPIPFIFLGVWVKIADRGTIRYNQALIITDDPRPDPANEKPDAITFEEVYRCGYCGKLLDEFGEELYGDEFELAVKRHKKYGEGIWIKSVGRCCSHNEK